MNLRYPVPEHANRSVLWIMAAILLTASLFTALRTAGQPVVVTIDHPAILPPSQAALQALPVPEPPHSQPAAYPRASGTPIPPGAQLRPAPQPIPTPPTGQ